MTRDAKQFLNLPVISLGSGNKLGDIDELIFQPNVHRLFGFVVKGVEDDRRLLVRKESVHAAGKDAVTVADEAALEFLDANDEAREIVGHRNGGHLTQMTVFSEDGEQLGKVDKVLLDDDLTVSAYHASSGILGLGSKTEIKPDEVVMAGEDTIVVRQSVASGFANLSSGAPREP